jgi:hypothetical protein
MAYIECGIRGDYFDTDEETLTLYVYLISKELIVFNNVLSDPSIQDGWLWVDHMLFSKRMTSLVLAMDVKYLSYYTTPKKEDD